jgi:hypothetical protein
VLYAIFLVYLAMPAVFVMLVLFFLLLLVVLEGDLLFVVFVPEFVLKELFLYELENSPVSGYQAV